jgi:hypothetical protein
MRSGSNFDDDADIVSASGGAMSVCGIPPKCKEEDIEAKSAWFAVWHCAHVLGSNRSAIAFAFALDFDGLASSRHERPPQQWRIHVAPSDSSCGNPSIGNQAVTASAATEAAFDVPCP